MDLQRRREQNRESQQKFRERNKKAYEDVLQALDTERQMTKRLKAEVTVLNSAVVSLRQEKHECLQAMTRFCRSMYDLPDDETEEVEGGG